jgi:hypothetical protein
MNFNLYRTRTAYDNFTTRPNWYGTGTSQHMLQKNEHKDLQK